MADFRIIYYILLVMFVLLTAVFVWGWITYSRTKTKTKFLNIPLLTATLGVAGIGLILAFVPIFMGIWNYDSDTVKQDAGFISILVLEFVFLAGFLALAYIYAFDFGIAIDQEQNKLQFFGQVVNTNKIVDLVEKKYSLKIVYEQGFKNLKKKISIYTPKAKQFIREQLADIIATNQINKAKTLTAEAHKAPDSQSHAKGNNHEHKEKIEMHPNLENS